MFLRRPRVRTNGIYVLKTTWCKEPVHDMWNPLPENTFVIHVTYYRYFMFFDDCVCLYSLTHEPPKKMVKKLEQELARRGGTLRKGKRGSVGRDSDKKSDIYVGTYNLRLNDVNVQVETPFSYVDFRAELRHGKRGHFARLRIKDHKSKPKAVASGSYYCYTRHTESIGLELHFRRTPLVGMYLEGL